MNLTVIYIMIMYNVIKYIFVIITVVYIWDTFSAPDFDVFQEVHLQYVKRTCFVCFFKLLHGEYFQFTFLFYAVCLLN